MQPDQKLLPVETYRPLEIGITDRRKLMEVGLHLAKS